jgi:hypothetical protein
MINFFRKIRKQLADDNKPLKYMRYAIGEILLVVIGILIALSINNWNDNRKLKIEAKSIKNALLIDLAKDTVQLRSRIELYEKYIMETNVVLEHFNTANNLKDIIISVTKFNPQVISSFTYNDATYNSIITSGKLDLLENEVKLALMENIGIQNNTLARTNQELYIRKLEYFSNKYSWAKKQLTPYLNTILETIEDERDFVTRFRSIIHFKQVLLPGKLANYEQSLKSTKSLIQLIKENS